MPYRSCSTSSARSLATLSCHSSPANLVTASLSTGCYSTADLSGCMTTSLWTAGGRPSASVQTRSTRFATSCKTDACSHPYGHLPHLQLHPSLGHGGAPLQPVPSSHLIRESLLLPLLLPLTP